VIVVQTVGAKLQRLGSRNRSLARKRPTPAEPDEEPEPVTVTRVTVIRGVPIDKGDAAQDWLASCTDRDTADAEVEEALALLNRVVHAYRVSAADPYAVDVSRGRARRTRLGYGAGDELVEGRWREAHAVPPAAPGGGRRRMLAPEEQIARILGGRRATHPSEELLLRARLDLDQQRSRTAALQAHAAHEALEAELEGDETAAQARATMREHADRLGDLAASALDRELTPEEREQLAETLRQMERVARRRRHEIEG
jgi:hypothetical protein